MENDNNNNNNPNNNFDQNQQQDQQQNNNNNFDQNQNQDNNNSNNNGDNNDGYGPNVSLSSLVQQNRGRGGFRGRGRAGMVGPSGPEMGVVTDRTVRVYIKNIPYALIEKFDDEALLAELTEASNGGVVRYTMFTDKTGRYTGQAMCTFRSAEVAEQTIQSLNGKQYSQNDAPLELEQAKDHGVVLTAKLRGMERENRLAEQPWRRGDRYGRMYNEDGSLKEQYENHHFGAANNYGRDVAAARRGGAGRGGSMNNNNFYRGPMTEDGLNGALANWNDAPQQNNNNNNNM